MSGTSALYSRLLFFALVCAAVMPFIMCSDAARASLSASPITTQVNNGVRPTVLRRRYTPHSRHHPVFTGLPSLQTGANRETETSGNSRNPLSVIHHHLKPLRLTKGSLSSNNSPVNRPSQAGPTSAQSGTSPASGYHPHSYNSYPVIIKKSSYKESASPFHQSADPAEVCDAKETQKSYIKEKVPRNDPHSLFLSQTGRYRSTSLPTSKGLYRGYKEPDELTSAGVRCTSSGIQSSKCFDLTSQTAPHAPSISSSSDVSVIESILSREKLTPSITDFFPGMHSVSGSETPRHKEIRPHLFKDSQTAFGGHETVQTVTDEGPSAFPKTSHKPRALEVISSFSSNGKRLQQSQKKDPTKEVQHLSDDANPPYHNANVTHYGARTDGFTKYQPAAQISAPEKDDFVGSFVPTPRANVPGNSAAGSSTSIVSSFSNATTRRSTHATTPGHNIYGFRGYSYPKWGAMKEPPILSSSGSNERANSRGYSFKITNMSAPLSPKYSFGRRKASAAVAKPEGAPTDYSSPSPGTHQGLTSGFEEARPGIPASDAGVDRNPDHGQFRIDRRIDGLEAFGTQSLEGATTSVSEPDESARVQQGFKRPGSQIREPKSSPVNPTSRTEPSSEDHAPLLGISSVYLRSAVKLDIESKPKSEAKTPDQTKPFATQTHLLHSSTSNTVRGKRVRGRAKKLNESTPFNNTGHEAIVWRPNWLRPINYAGIVASTSFNGVRATTQTPITPAGKDDFDASAATQQKEGARYGTLNSEEAVRSGGDTEVRGPEDVGENKLADRSEEVDNDLKTSDLFLDNEGSGSEDFDASDVLSAATTKSQGLDEDVPELEYLRISPGNVSFKAINLSHTET